MFHEGETTLKISIPDDNFIYGSICKLIIDINNINGKKETQKCKITLIRRIKFKNNKGEVKYEEETKIIKKKIQTIVNAGIQKTFEYNLLIKEENIKKNNINNKENDEMNFLMPTTHGKTVSCDYEIKYVYIIHAL